MMAKSWKGTHIPNRTLRCQTSRFHCVSCRHSAPHHLHTVRFDLLQSLHTSHFTLASVSWRELMQGSDSCGPHAHTTTSANPRTPCHLTMQARRLRVPDSCDDHTTTSFLIANSLAESRYRTMHTLALPDPLLTQWSITPAFRQVVRLGASWPLLFTCVCLHTSQLVAASLWCLPS